MCRRKYTDSFTQLSTKIKFISESGVTGKQQKNEGTKKKNLF